MCAEHAKTFPVSWDELHRHARALAWRLLEHAPWQGIIAITRGGLVPAAIVARELAVDAFGEHRLLPRPYDRAVIRTAIEHALQLRRGEHRVRDDDADRRAQPGRKRSRDPARDLVEHRRGRHSEQQDEAVVAVHHGNRRAIGIERESAHHDRTIDRRDRGARA